METVMVRWSDLRGGPRRISEAMPAQKGDIWRRWLTHGGEASRRSWFARAKTCLFCIPSHSASLCNSFRSANQRHGNLVAEHELWQGFVVRHVCAYKVRLIAAAKVARHVCRCVLGLSVMTELASRPLPPKEPGLPASQMQTLSVFTADLQTIRTALNTLIRDKSGNFVICSLFVTPFFLPPDDAWNSQMAVDMAGHGQIRTVLFGAQPLKEQTLLPGLPLLLPTYRQLRSPTVIIVQSFVECSRGLGNNPSATWQTTNWGHLRTPLTHGPLPAG